MSTKPILFSTPMVQALLEDRKWQTRRVIKFPSYIKEDMDEGHFRLLEEDGSYSYGWSIQELVSYGYLKRPYRRGDVLYVRETWKPQDYQFIDGMWNCAIVYKAGGMEGRVYWPDGTGSIYERCGIWRPSIHMPREAARLFLRVTDVRVEQVQDINEEDAKAEGVTPINDSECGYRGAFRELWNALNAKRGFDWYSNPWVWVYSFERVDKPAGWPGGEVEE